MKRWLAVLISLTFTCATTAQPTTQPNALTIIVTRVDVTRAAMQLDRLVRDHPMTDAQQREINPRFDALFTDDGLRRPSLAVRSIHELTDQLAPTSAPSANAKVARAMRVRISPRVANAKHLSALHLKLSPLYPLQLDRAVTLHLQVIRDDPTATQPVIDEEISVDPSGLIRTLTLRQPPNLPLGRYRVELVSADGFHARADDWYVSDLSIEVVRRENDKQLRKIGVGTECATAAKLATAWRNALLGDEISESDSTRMFFDPGVLAHAIAHDLDEIERDRDPFVDCPGDYWRTIPIGPTQTPVRIFAPSAAVNGDDVPLVIALSGAGWDENAFLEAYGCGALKQLAEKRGFLLVAPRTDYLVNAPNAVDHIVRVLSFNYRIDRSRVYVIGHAIGGALAQQWANQFGDRIAGACLFMDPQPGSNDKPASNAAPIVPPGAAPTKDFGGATLGVGEKLPEAVDWLLKQSLLNHRKS